MRTIANPAPAPLALTVIRTDSGEVTVPCEPINEWLVITPDFGMDGEAKTWLSGGFVVTHVPTGTALTEGPGCIACCRWSGGKLAALDADWSTLTRENQGEWAAALSDAAKTDLATYRPVAFLCDAEPCGHS